MKHNLCNIQESSKENHIAISLKGNWYKWDNGFLRVTILKDLLIVSSGISEREENIDVELPTRKQFFLQIAGAEGVETVLVEGRIRMNLSKGKQVYGICNL